VIFKSLVLVGKCPHTEVPDAWLTCMFWSYWSLPDTFCGSDSFWYMDLDFDLPAQFYRQWSKNVNRLPTAVPFSRTHAVFVQVSSLDQTVPALTHANDSCIGAIIWSSAKFPNVRPCWYNIGLRPWPLFPFSFTSRYLAVPFYGCPAKYCRQCGIPESVEPFWPNSLNTPKCGCGLELLCLLSEVSAK